ncbi:MAG: ABC transporter permease subunit [Spirochaetales bacterium]|nr:ABC transporter permease subunit [Spirochaetales bacterium]
MSTGTIKRDSFSLWFKKNIIKYRFFHLLALPGIIYFILFKYVPILGLSIAFKDYNGMGGIEGIINAPWVGLDNFRDLFSSPSFFKLLRNTLVISLMRLFWGFPMPIIFALMLNEVRKKRFKNIVQTITYMPHFLSWVIVSGLAVMLLSPSSGPLVPLFDFFHIKPINFLGSTDTFRGVLVASSIWKDLGWGTIIYLAAISGISQDQYEAARIEGASRFQKTRYITLPSIKFVITIFFILRVGKIINENFEQIFNMYSPVVYSVSDVFETYIYRRGIIGADYSFTTAAGLFKSFVSLALVIITNKVAKLLGEDGIW